jgi:hypothetical protein
MSGTGAAFYKFKTQMTLNIYKKFPVIYVYDTFFINIKVGLKSRCRAMICTPCVIEIAKLPVY